MSDKEFALVSGGKYLIRVSDEDDTIGIFKGYCALGNGDVAVVMEINDEKLRFIPVAQIVLIDVLETNVPDSEKKRPVDVNYV